MKIFLLTMAIVSAVVFLFFLILFIGSVFSKSCDKDAAYRNMQFFFAIIVLIAGICSTELFRCYKDPHNGNAPTIEMVSTGEARIDTIYTIMRDETIVTYKINWND